MGARAFLRAYIFCPKENAFLSQDARFSLVDFIVGLNIDALLNLKPQNSKMCILKVFINGAPIKAKYTHFGVSDVIITSDVLPWHNLSYPPSSR